MKATAVILGIAALVCLLTGLASFEPAVIAMLCAHGGYYYARELERMGWEEFERRMYEAQNG